MNVDSDAEGHLVLHLTEHDLSIGYSSIRDVLITTYGPGTTFEVESPGIRPGVRCKISDLGGLKFSAPGTKGNGQP